jgi:hypothetical protein
VVVVAYDLKSRDNFALVALVAVTLTSVITGGVTVFGQIPENGQNLNASEIDRSTTIVERTSSTSTEEYETGFAQANGMTIAYESFGHKDQENVLLIAGTGSTYFLAHSAN